MRDANCFVFYPSLLFDIARMGEWPLGSSNIPGILPRNVTRDVNRDAIIVGIPRGFVLD